METLSTTKAAKQQTVKMKSDLNALTQFSNDPKSVSESLFFTAVANIFSSGSLTFASASILSYFKSTTCKAYPTDPQKL